MDKPISPSFPNADDGKTEKKEKPNSKAFKKAYEKADSKQPNQFSSKEIKKGKKHFKSTEAKTSGKEQPKEQATASTSQKKAEGKTTFPKGQPKNMHEDAKKVQSEPFKEADQPKTPPEQEKFAQFQTDGNNSQKETKPVQKKTEAKTSGKEQPKEQATASTSQKKTEGKTTFPKGQQKNMHEDAKKVQSEPFKEADQPKTPPEQEKFAQFQTDGNNSQKETKPVQKKAEGKTTFPKRQQKNMHEDAKKVQSEPFKEADQPKTPPYQEKFAQFQTDGNNSQKETKPVQKKAEGKTTFSIPDNLKQKISTFKQMEKPGEETAIIVPDLEESGQKAQVTDKDLLEIFQKAEQDVPEAKVLAKEIREKYPSKAKELDKFIEKEIPRLRPEKERVKHKTKKESPFANLGKGESFKPEQKPQQTNFIIFNPPQEVRSQAVSTTTPVNNVLPTEMVPLFEHMVGSLIHMESQGISKTDIILSNPEFSSSRFYGTKVTFEKFSTAPDSYNITFTGSEEAITIIRENMGSLQTAFNKADLNFKVNDIRAEHEPMEFKRKPSVGKDQDTGV